MKRVLEILSLIFSRVNICFTKKKFVEQNYTNTKTLETISLVEIINKFFF